MNANFKACGYCEMTWDSTHGAEECPICELVDKIDQHIESILLQIVTSHYSKYIFEIDDKTAAWNREHGFSFRINRKHNLIYLRMLDNISLKNTYLLMASHVESAFNNIQQIYKRTYGKNPSGVNSDTKLYKIFTNKIEESGLNESIFKSIKHSEIVNYVRLVSNIIKHNSSVVKADGTLGKLIKIKDNVNLEELWGVKLPKIRRQLHFADVCEIAHLLRIFLIDLSLELMPSCILKIKNITTLNSLSLLKVKLRENVSDEILKDMHNEGIMLFFPAFFKKANDSRLFLFLKERIIFLEKLLKMNPKYVVALETGIGFIPDNKYISTMVIKMNALISSMHQNRIKTKDSSRKFRKLYISMLDKLSIKYGRERVSDLVWNEFDNINKKIFPQLIVDFYKEIYAVGKKDAGILIRGFGGSPFKKWNPFNFNT